MALKSNAYLYLEMQIMAIFFSTNKLQSNEDYKLYFLVSGTTLSMTVP